MRTEAHALALGFTAAFRDSRILCHRYYSLLDFGLRLATDYSEFK